MLRPVRSNSVLAFDSSTLFRADLCFSCRRRGAGNILSHQAIFRRSATINANKQGSNVKKNKTIANHNSNQSLENARIPNSQATAQLGGSQANQDRGQVGNEEFAPLQLDRPIGLVYPPKPGQNTGIDLRSIGERRDDFVDHEKHLARRRELTRQIAKPYFREWSNLKYHEGKTFISNSRLFKREKALYFPNMYGVTLASPKKPENTTLTLKGKISVVTLFSSLWAESQVATFTGEQQNPGLHDTLRSGHKYGEYIAQKVDINLEENAMKAWLVRMFMWRMRQNLSDQQHSRYFLVRKGLTEGLKEAIGVLNTKVGYVYLLDDDCRIRWAGSGPAEGMEKEALNHGLKRLIDEKLKASTKARQTTPT